MINLYELEQFLAFSETNTLMDVAERFHISSPTISRNMRHLEKTFGVSLFERTKNHIKLNETGKLAAKEAQLVIKQVENMLNNVRAFDIANRTISVGSCSIVPCIPLIRQLHLKYPDCTITTDVRDVPELVRGLAEGHYQLAILPSKLPKGNLTYKELGCEQLYFLLPKEHPLANQDSLSMKQMDGESMLIYQEIGFWKDILKKKMPHSRLLVQADKDSFMELITNTKVPSFTTNFVGKEHSIPPDRISIPISDSEVSVTYYLVCKKENAANYNAILSEYDKREK